MSESKSFLSVSCAASVIMALYMSMALLNLYRLMYPMTLMDASSFQESRMVGPLWDEASRMRLKVYLSSRERFQLDFLQSDDHTGEDDEPIGSSSVKLLWEEDLTTASLARSFLLTTLDCDDSSDSSCQNDGSYKYASKWLDDAEHMHEEKEEGGISAILSSAGEGIESTSVLLSLYLTITKQIGRFLAAIGILSKNDSEEHSIDSIASNRKVIKLSRSSPLWSALRKNQTLHAHAVLTRNDVTDGSNPTSYQDAARSLMRAQKSHSLLLGHVNLVKYDLPSHIDPPRRVLYHDIAFLWKRYILHSIDESSRPPWDMAYSRPEEYEIYQQALQMKSDGAGYPYWKPQVSIKYVNEDVRYPINLAHTSGMELVQLGSRSSTHPTGYAMIPGLHVDEMGLTSEKYIPVNGTLTSLPLRVSFDRNDIINEKRKTTATAGGISPARWRLLMHLSKSLESQKELGFEQSDIDDLRRLIADTNVTLLTITMLASALHLLFEFLTFKNEVSFWRRNKDLTGLSVRSLFLDMFSQVIILLFLIEKDSSLLMTIPSGIGCLIAMWKCQRGAGFKFVPVKPSASGQKIPWWNMLPRMFGYELQAIRLQIASGKDKKNDKKTSEVTSSDLAALTIETDRIATRTLGAMLIPVVLIYTLYSFFMEEHTGWYSWLITSASSAVYALGFVLMTPQLFLNYKLKSVAHLPWRVLVYKFLNTFIDDLFAFIIRMPTMARISCFRDDVVFIIYLYQRWLYPVDASRPVEGGDGPTTEDREKKNQ